MNTCKDCIHYEVCQYHIDEETAMTVNECPHGFLHKDQLVKLPAYVGQSVWVVRTTYKYEDNQFKETGAEVREGKVSMLQQKADKSWKIRVTENRSVSDYKAEDFGVTLFTSLEDAVIKARG